MTLQTASDRRVDEEGAASVDLFVRGPVGPGELAAHLEGSTAPGGRGVSAFLPDANADVRSALDGEDDGRIQISELHYGVAGETLQLVAGLLDPAAFIDGSEVANDETNQFLNATLVNNPTIALPDYTLGLALQREARTGAAGITLLLAGSHGLADNPDRSYGELFDLDAEGKGVFAAAELQWRMGEWTPRVGVWVQTADHERLDGTGRSEGNRGLYASVDGTSRAGCWNLRAGVADEKVSEAAWFAGAAMERPFGADNVGLGVTHTAVSDDARRARAHSLADTTQAELYVRLALGARWHLTPSLQVVHNPGFDGSGNEFDREVWVAGIRLSAGF